MEDQTDDDGDALLRDLDETGDVEIAAESDIIMADVDDDNN